MGSLIKDLEKYHEMEAGYAERIKSVCFHGIEKPSNILKEMGFEAGIIPPELLKPLFYHSEYYSYVSWMQDNGIKDTDFFVGRELNAYKRW